MNHWRVPPDEIDYIWPSVKDLIEAALDRSGLFGINDAYCHVVNGTWQLWVVHEKRNDQWSGAQIECVVLTEIIDYPKDKVLRVTMATGSDRTKWVDRIEVIEGWAKSLGCERIQVLGRPGWERVLKDYRKTHVMLEKQL